MMDLTERLDRLGACAPALFWARYQESDYMAWCSCNRGDWLLWIAARVGVDRKLVVLAACDCARTTLQYVPDGETLPLTTIETIEAWCRGEASMEQVRVVARDADAIAHAADADAYVANAYIAAYSAAAYAAARDADSADAAADAAAVIADVGICAHLVRWRIPWSVMECTAAVMRR